MNLKKNNDSNKKCNEIIYNYTVLPELYFITIYNKVMKACLFA